MKTDWSICICMLYYLFIFRFICHYCKCLSVLMCDFQLNKCVYNRTACMPHAKCILKTYPNHFHTHLLRVRMRENSSVFIFILNNRLAGYRSWQLSSRTYEWCKIMHSVMYTKHRKNNHLLYEIKWAESIIAALDRLQLV